MKLGVIFGGSSYEHEISIVSAITIKKVLDKFNRDLEFIFVDQNRDFYLIDSNNMKSKFFSSLEYKKRAKRLSLKKDGFFIDSLFGSKRVDIDCVLNLIHGRDGEDGKIASLFDFFNIKYIGPRVEASVISFNKLYTKWFAREIGIDILDYQLIRKNEAFELKFNFPVIIKPLRLGSSIGVSIARSKEELEYGLDVAFEFDDEVLIEPFIENIREFNIAGAKGREWILSNIEEPKKNEFLDFDKKYLDFSRQETISQANIDNNLKEYIRNSFKKIYDPLFRGAIIRCDFFYYQDRLYLNEINPVPGSMANYLFDDFNRVIDEVVSNLPSQKEIKVEYLYINKIQKAKGKA